MDNGETKCPALQFDISFSVNKRSLLDRVKGNEGKTVHILENIKGSFESGELIALMGASGGGKTTLMDILACRKSVGNIEGTVLYHGVPKKKLTNQEAGYVFQSDVALANLTVKETIIYQIKLRIAGLKDDQIDELAEQLMEDMMISHCANNRVGDAMIRGISGGELRRLSIVQDLVNNPNFLFLDEPTSGLDSKASFEVVSILKRLAKSRNQVIVLTIHQPSSQTFALFDKLLLISKSYSPVLGKKVGKVAYFGAVNQVASYFANHLGLPCPPEKNIADHILDAYEPTKGQKLFQQSGVTSTMSTVGLTSEQIIIKNDDDEDNNINNNNNNDNNTVTFELNLADKFEEYLAENNIIQNDLKNYKKEKIKHSHSEEELKERESEEKTPPTSSYPTSTFNQLCVLLERTTVDTVRTPNFVLTRLFKPHFIGAIISSIYFRLDYSPLAVQNRISGVFFVLLTTFMLSSGLQPVFILDRPITIREKASKLYGPFVHLLTTLSVVLPLEVFNGTLFITYLNWITNLFPTAAGFFKFMLLYLLLTVLMDVYSLLIGAVSSSAEAAAVLSPVIFLFFLIVCGFFVLTEALPVWWRWAKWISPYYYALASSLHNQFNDVTWNCTREINSTIANCTFPSGNELLTFYGISLTEGTYWAYNAALVGYIALCFILLFIALKFIKWDRR